jgi:peptidoglycan/LPS O-acetylase OafA/YrhL
MMIAMGWTGFGSFFGPDYTTWCQYGYISQTIGYSLTGALYGSLLVLVLTHRPWARFFSNPLLRFFGKYSYALYVFHIFVFFYVAEFFALGDPSRFSILRHMSIQGVVLFDQDQSFALILDGICYLLLAVGISVALALISWRLVELPFLRMKKAFPQGTHRADGPDLITSLTHGAGANLQSGKLGVESLPGS